MPELRKWLFTPWPWISGVIALAVFSPTLIWNASIIGLRFSININRLVVHEWSLRYLGEFLSPRSEWRRRRSLFSARWVLSRFCAAKAARSARAFLVNAMVWPIFVYFVWHTFHGRVEGNWPEPIYVAFVIAAAVAAELHPMERRLGVAGLVVAAARRAGWTCHSGLHLCAGGIRGLSARARSIRPRTPWGPGWRQLGVQMDQVRQRIGAPVVLTMDYGLASWLAFYMPSHPPVEQINGRMRYVNAPEPDPALFRGTIMYVCMVECADIPDLRKRFTTVEPVAALSRTRHGVDPGLSHLQHAGSDRAAA